MPHFLRALATFLLGLGSCFAAHAQGTDGALRKLRTVTTDVQFLVTPGVPYALSASKLEAVLGERLRSAGLRVLSKAEDANDKTSNPVVRLQIQVVGVSAAGGSQIVACAYRVDLMAHQLGRSPLNGASAPVELWRTGNVGFSGKDEFGRDVQQMVDTMITEFVGRQQAANTTK